MSDLTQSERWEYYRESMPPVDGVTISFDTVRIVGGRNLFRCHDPERAKLAASAPLLLDALLAQEEAERAEDEFARHHNRVFWKDADDRTPDDHAETSRLKDAADNAKAKARALRTAALAATKD